MIRRAILRHVGIPIALLLGLVVLARAGQDNGGGSTTSAQPSGTVSQVSAGNCITLTPTTITTTGSVALTTPASIGCGGTNATSMATTDGVVYYDGTRLVTTAVGSATQVLTSNGAGVAPTFQAAGGGGVTFPLLAPNGSSGAPSYSFTNGTDGGLFAPSNGAITLQASASGALNLNSGSAPTEGVGGNLTLNGGNAATATATFHLGGFININAGNSAGVAHGGQIEITAGNGGATGAGGGVGLNGGAGGATSGDGGAAQITAGSASTSGNGGAVQISAGGGTGTNKNGGNVVISTGASTGSGTPGQVQVNGDPSIMETTIGYQALDPNNRSFFTATRAMLITAAICRENAATGAAATLTIMKAVSGTAFSAGTAIHSGSYNGNSTANTNQTLTLSTTLSVLQLAAGTSLGVTTTGTWTSGTGSCTVHMTPQ